ncbi:uncharacterized protein ARMOST_02829 [Armillaria ostoyae]|uniref:SHSP domain-containing protein n=1 Tax=Armillaria ostoyae TaxID=47428 RepID=A0A284QSR5_ARMOS|nr:uncharacterized protein ARMOST_02829 [Armillaria ostoyae]
MSVFYYEPFYNWDRIIDLAFASSAARSQADPQHHLGENSHSEIQRFLKPRMDIRENASTNTVTASFEFPGVVVGPVAFVSAIISICLEHSDSLFGVSSGHPTGLSKDDISIDVHNGRMTVSAESKISEEHGKDGYAVRERRYGNFARTLQLPRGVNDDEIKASMQDGVLTVTFPKVAAEAPGPKKIAIA